MFIENKEITEVANGLPKETTEAPPAQEVPTEPPKQSPEMDAAQFIMMNLPRFRAKIEELTGVQVKRVLSRLIESPLEEETEPFTTQAAVDCFNLGMMIQNAKHILFLASIKAPDAEKVIEKGLEEEKKKLEAEASEGQTNGS